MLSTPQRLTAPFSYTHVKQVHQPAGLQLLPHAQSVSTPLTQPCQANHFQPKLWPNSAGLKHSESDFHAIKNSQAKLNSKTKAKTNRAVAESFIQATKLPGQKQATKTKQNPRTKQQQSNH